MRSTSARDPVVSVIVVAYNQAPAIHALLASLSAQAGHVPYEVLCCDDGSSDDTPRVVSDWQRSTDIDVHYIWQPDRAFRAARARNNGIHLARGELLIFVDGDSLLRPFFLQAHLDAHRHHARVVYGGREEVEMPERASLDDWQALLDLPPVREDLGPARQWLSSDRPWMACVSANLSVRREHRVWFDEQFEGWGSEDRDCVYRLWQAGLAVHLLDRPTAVQPVRENDTVPWNPFRGGGPETVEALLRNKLHLFRKYPGDLMAPSLELVRYCYLNRDTGRWRIGRRRGDVSVAEILDEYVAWSTRPLAIETPQR